MGFSAAARKQTYKRSGGRQEYKQQVTLDTFRDVRGTENGWEATVTEAAGGVRRMGNYEFFSSLS